MSDEQIVKAITQNVVLATVFHAVSRVAIQAKAEQKAEHLKSLSQQFMTHAIKLLATHKEAVQRWMDTRKATA